MDNMGKQIVWQRIRGKLEKGEQVDPGDIIWGILLNGGLSNKGSFLGQNIVDSLEKALKDHQEISSKNDSELKALYLEKKDAHFKELTESKEFFKKFQDRCKEIKAEINGSKVDSDIKNASINLMRDYLDMLNREIISSEKFPDYEDWKKDCLNVSNNQVGYLKQRVKKAKKEVVQNVKLWDKTEKAFQIPEHLKQKDNGTKKEE